MLSANIEERCKVKLKEMEARRKRYGDSIYLLEPHVKEGEGGLRDLHTALWIAKIVHRVDTFGDLVRLDIITAEEHRILDRARAFLWAVRNDLHLHAGHRTDRLTLAEAKKYLANLADKRAREAAKN